MIHISRYDPYQAFRLVTSGVTFDDIKGTLWSKNELAKSALAV